MQPVAVTSTPGGCPVAAGKRAGRQTAQAAGAGSKFCHTLPASLRAPLSRAERPGGRNSRLVVANTASLEAQAQQVSGGRHERRRARHRTLPAFACCLCYYAARIWKYEEHADAYMHVWPQHVHTCMRDRMQHCRTAERRGSKGRCVPLPHTCTSHPLSVARSTLQAPPGTPAPKTKYAASAEVVMAAPGVDILRVACTARLPEVEFNLRRGTTTNSYLLKVT